MKPKPTASRPRDDTPPKRTRRIFVKDETRSLEGFPSYEEAAAARMAMGNDSESQRTRVSFRSRTGRWDVLVKVAQEQPIED